MFAFGHFELDFRGHIPIYVQIVEHVRRMIAAEVLKPGDQLPTVRQLAADLRVNFNTIARAYRMLDEDGVISTQQGRGTFVLEPLPPERATRLRKAALEELTKTFLQDAEHLGFEPKEIVEVYEAMIEERNDTNQKDEGKGEA